VLGSLIAVVLAWLAAALGLRLAYADEVLPGTRMAGVALGGASEAEVRRRLAGAPGTAVTLTHGSTRFPVRGTAAGLDLRASAEQAMAAGREGPLRGVWSSVAAVLAPRAVEPEYRSDRAALRVVAAAARQVDRPPFGGDLSIDLATLRATVKAPRPGRAVDRPRTAGVLTAALRRGEGGEVPMIVRARPAARPADVQAVRRRAERYLASPLRLTGAGPPVTVTPRRLAPVLALEAVGHAARPRVRLGVRRASLARLVGTIAAERRRRPVDARIIAPAGAGLLAEQLDASWSPRPARVRVRPSRPGRELPSEAAIAAIAEAVRAGSHEATLSLRRVPARISTGEARRVTSLIGTFTTPFPCCQPRVTNIRLIAEAIDGTVVAPGERFSLNQTAGPRTREKGYVPAPFIADGELVDSVGGGVSQMSTTVYNAAYFAGLHIDSRTPHSFYISRYPPGREATLDYPGIDLVWTNDTRAPVLVRATTTPTSVSVSLYGDNGRRRVRAEAGPRQPVPGRDFAITVTRKVTGPDGRTTSEPSTTTYDRPPP
jgi:vancomycin resistance protein YoaR